MGKDIKSMKKEIETELIKILNSFSNNNDLVHCINYFINTKVLNKNELVLCTEILNALELTNVFNLKKIVEKQNIHINEDDYKKKYKVTEVFEKQEAFVVKRRQSILEKLQQQAYENLLNGNYDIDTIGFIYNRYSDAIFIKEDNTFDELEEINENRDNIITTIPEIDYYLKGLVEGTITTIVGDNMHYKSILSLNIAYNAIKNGRNVFYLSIGNTKKNIYKRLLVRHSCSEDRFQKLSLGLSYNVLDRNYGAVYYDFKENLLNNLIVLDEEENYISTHFSLLKLISYTDRKFRDRSNKGIDLIIIDDLSYMKLFDGKRFISNKNTIANEFYSFLKNQAIRLLGGRSIPILATYGTLNSFRYNSELSIPDIITNLSDNIIMVSCEQADIKTSKMFVQVCKNSNSDEVMDIAVPIPCDYAYWYIYDNFSIEDELNPKLALEEARRENNRLLIENNAYIGNNNEILRKLNNIETEIEVIKNNADINKSEENIIIPDMNSERNVSDILEEFIV